MLADLRLAIRQLIRSPGYALVVVLTLAFGIAVNTNLFGMVSVFFLRKMPVPDADRIVLVLQRSPGWNAPHPVSFPDFKDYRERIQSLEWMLAYQSMPVNISAEGQTPQRGWLDVVTPNAFAALGVQAKLGRMLLPSDGENKGGAPVVVLTYDCWRQRFGGSPEIVGKVVRLNGRPFTVVGVAAEEFKSLSAMSGVHCFVPTGALDSLKENGADMMEWRGATLWKTLGKLKPGVTLESLQAETAIITQQLVRDHADDHTGVTSVVIPEHRARPEPLFADYTPIFAAFFLGMVVLVLGIACANVANLMIARASFRQKELTVRIALGASRLQLIRQLLVESILLAAIAGVAGWFLATGSTPLINGFMPKGDIPINVEPGSPWLQYLFTACVSLVAGVASGLLPALRASRIDLSSHLKSGHTASPDKHRLRNLFVVNQVTFSLVVIIFAALFARSLQHAYSANLGYRTENLLIASFDLSLQGYPEEKMRQFCRQVAQEVRTIPGVTDASITSCTPMDYRFIARDILPENPPPSMEHGTINVGTASVAPGFEDMMGLKMIAGRTLAAGDVQSKPMVAVVNEKLAQDCWPGQDPIGKRFRPWRGGPWIEVVGLTATAKYMMLGEAPRPFFYVSLEQRLESPLTLLVRTQQDPVLLASAVRSAVLKLDPHLPLYNVRAMDEMMSNSAFAFWPLRMGLVFAMIQGVIGLGLALLGLYAVVAFGVAQRTREIGIRMALGADPGSVVRTMLKEGLRLTIQGVLIGFILSALIGLALSKVLYGMRAFDPVVLLGGAGLLLLVSILACWLPARRATRIDPMIALRTE